MNVELVTSPWYQEFKQLLADPTRARLLILSLILGLGGASIYPVLSLHFVADLGVEPLMVGVYFGCNTLAGVIISQLIARVSDGGVSRIRILVIAIFAALNGAIVLAVVDLYWLLLLLGAVSFGLGAAAQPQLFAMSREQVTGSQAPLFQSVMRAQISLSWIIGPPLAYLIFEQWGFQVLMSGTVMLYGVALLLLMGLSSQKTPVASHQVGKDKRIPWLVFAIATIFAANSMYIIYMPLHITQDLHLGTVVPGLLMGLVAGLEIPVMIGSGVLAKRWPLLRPLWLSGGAGSLFFIGFALVDNLTALVVLQLFNALFVGLSAGLGLVVFQTLMPHRLGGASTLFTSASSSGAMLGSSLGGVIAQWWGYSSVFWCCAVMCVLSMLAIGTANRFSADDKALI